MGVPDLSAGLARILDRLAAPRGTAALAVAIGPPTELHVAWAPRALDDEPGFLAYSITKTFTSALVLRLQEEGRLSLDAPLSRWCPDVPSADRIVLRQLLNHTAGIPDYGGLSAYHDAVRRSPGQPWSPRRFAAETFEKGLLFEPGTDWAYSNVGYMLLRSIVEAVGGGTYPDLISRHVASPLDLRRTFVARSIDDLASLAPAPSALLSADGRLVDTREAYHPGWVSHGVVASTPSDIVRFLAVVAHGGLLSSPSLREMTTFVRVPRKFVPTRPGPDAWREPSYGLGLMGDPASPWGPVWGHNGGGPGYSTSAFCAPDLGPWIVTVCAMCAIEEDAIAERMVRAVLDLVRGAER